MSIQGDSFEGNLDSHSFISILRLIDCKNTDKPRIGRASHPRDESVRLSQKPASGFQGKALDSLQEREGLHEYQLFCNFFGLFGSNGILPLHYTEYADQRERHHQDSTFSAFLDLFNHRMLSLFYRASVEFEPSVNLDRVDGNSLEEMLSAIGGYATPASRRRDGIPDHVKRFNAGWMGRVCKSPDGIKALLAQYFDLEVKVEEFTGGWLDLPDDAIFTLGGSASGTSCGNALLGVSTYLGRRSWGVSHKFTVVLGPIDWNDYLSFKPGGSRAIALYELVRNYCADEWDWDIKFVVTNVEGSRLNHKSRLGFNSVLSRSLNASKGVRQFCFNKNVLVGERRLCKSEP